MAKVRFAITVDEQVIATIDRLVKEGAFQSRSNAIESVFRERIARRHRSRLARECAKLDISEEQALAEESYAGEIERSHGAWQ